MLKALRRVAPAVGRTSAVSQSAAFFSALAKPLSVSAAAAAAAPAAFTAAFAAPSGVSAPLARFSVEVAEAAPIVIENDIVEHATFVSSATRGTVELCYRNLKIADTKLDVICRLVRGLSVREALNQLSLAERNHQHLFFFRRALHNMTRQASHTFNMAPERLVVSEAYATRSYFIRKLNVKGRGRTGIISSPRAHLFLKVAEQAYHPREVRIGRYGPSIAHTKRVDSVVSAWKARRSAD
jgi:large subunit ribosomal protein L22